ncbi:MAG: hypothetical protein PHN37_00910 [Candidatus Pacebacteria bacterium]|nr:hypothetical protein [Candidatus Paceibacterota bacterium]
MKSFTLLEILIVILIFLILLAIAFPFFSSQKKEPSQDIIYSLLHRARLNALAGFKDSSWGVNIAENQATLFMGESYDQRNSEFDKLYSISCSEEKEIVFEKITGFVQNPGKIINIYVNDLGIISINELEAVDRENIDSRRVLVYYNNFINSEGKIILNDQEFLIQDYLENDILNLEYENILIRSLRFNSPDTVFVVKRDRRLNDQVLTIYLEQDPGFIIKYSADGSETTHESLFVEQIKWE